MLGKSDPDFLPPCSSQTSASAASCCRCCRAVARHRRLRLADRPGHPGAAGHRHARRAAAEAAMLKLREQAAGLFLGDGSAIVTAWLIALAFPPLAPWWLVVVGTLFAIVVAKHLYGGLGQNPFNPAMVAFAVCIVSFPALMSQWPSVGLQAAASPSRFASFRPGAAPRRDDRRNAARCAEDALKLGEGSVDVPRCWPTRTFSAISPARLGMGGRPATCSAACGCGSARSSPGTRRSAFIAACRRCSWRALWLWNPSSSPTRCSTCSPAAPCSAPSSSSPTRFPAARRRAAS
jgi:hypothetical protein